jgi:MFS family permease
LGLQAFAVAAVLIGFAQGAEVDVVAYLVSRYLPPARFGRIFGLQFSLFTLGAANGPLFVVMASSRFGGFSQPLFAIALLGLLTSALCLLLPRYSRTPADRADAAAALPP